MDLLRFRDELIVTKITSKASSIKKSVNENDSEGLDWSLDILPIFPKKNPELREEQQSYFEYIYSKSVDNVNSSIEDVRSSYDEDSLSAEEELEFTTDMLPATFCETTVTKDEAEAGAETFSLTSSKSKSEGKLKKFRCTECPYSTNVSSHFRAHKRRHTGERPFGCNLCPYRAAEACTLNRHKLTHSGSKKHSCPICPYRAFLPGDVTKHMRCHTGEKPYWCPLCPYRASRQGSVKEHLATHALSKEYACELCGHLCSTKVQLRRHINNKHFDTLLLRRPSQ